MYSDTKINQLTSLLKLNAFLQEFPEWQMLFKYLTPRQQEVLAYRFGLKKFDETWIKWRSQKDRAKVVIPTFLEIGNHLGISATSAYNCFIRGYENLKIAKENKNLLRHYQNQKEKNQKSLSSSKCCR